MFIRPVMEVVYTVEPNSEREINDNMIFRRICFKDWKSNIEEIKEISKNNNNKNKIDDIEENKDNLDVGKLLIE